VLKTHESEGTVEQLFARFEGESLQEICCIPFYSYNLALGDVVSANDNNEVNQLVSPSGKLVFRAWFEDGLRDAADFESKVALHGGICEWYSQRLVAVDAANEDMASAIAGYLQSLEDSQFSFTKPEKLS
jgi:hypothetical protein